MPSRTRRHPSEHAVRDLALAYPEAQESFPWPNHRAIKVRGKAFVIMSADEPELSLSVKLPWSAEGVLQLPSCEPTGYGLGRSGWITATYGARQRPPLDALRSWIDESYRAVAPKRVVAQLEAAKPSPAATRAAGRARSRATRPGRGEGPRREARRNVGPAP
jgi:predicted DNA-binding protein (MmcQ/YjbR family)